MVSKRCFGNIISADSLNDVEWFCTMVRISVALKLSPRAKSEAGVEGGLIVAVVDEAVNPFESHWRVLEWKGVLSSLTVAFSKCVRSKLSLRFETP
jgi:hypothetical protein